MGLKREYIANIWICDYCGHFQDGKDKGYRKDGYILCKKCKHMSKEAIERKKKENDIN